jgi:hypothetical protein
MYFPYLRGKQFELEALLDVNPSVFRNTLPIVESITLGRRNLYARLSAQNVPLILVTNPFYPQTNTLLTSSIQNVIDNELANHASLTVGLIIDQRFNVSHLAAFLSSNPLREKAIVFRSNPTQTVLAAIQGLLALQPVSYLIFDESKTTSRTQVVFNNHLKVVLLTDGFQRQERNADYPANSAFDSIYNTWTTTSWYGIGDYVTIGDFFREGGGQAYVVCLHMTVPTTAGLIIHHFSSISHPKTATFPALKFTEANNTLNNSALITPLSSTGLDLYRHWHNTQHYPGLGAAKKASMMHHIEIMSGVI